MTRLVGLVLDALTNYLPRVFHGSLGAQATLAFSGSWLCRRLQNLTTGLQVWRPTMDQ